MPQNQYFSFIFSVHHETFLEHLKNTPFFLRFTIHDGFPAPIIEAMSYGCEVMMSMPYPPVTVVRNEVEAIEEFKKMMERVRDRGMKPNPEMIHIARRDFEKQHVISSYLERLRSITGR